MGHDYLLEPLGLPWIRNLAALNKEISEESKIVLINHNPKYSSTLMLFTSQTAHLVDQAASLVERDEMQIAELDDLDELDEKSVNPSLFLSKQMGANP